MKNLLIFLACSIPVLMGAQSRTLDTYFDAFPDSDDILKVELSGFFLNLTAKTDNGDSYRSKGIKSLRLVGTDKFNPIPKGVKNRLIPGLQREGFETLSEIRSDGDQIKFLIRESKGYITDLVAIIRGEDGSMVIALEGSFRMEDLDNLDLDIEGFDKIKKAKKEIPRA